MYLIEILKDLFNSKKYKKSFMFNWCDTNSLSEDKSAFQKSFQLLASTITKLMFNSEGGKKLV